MSGSLFPGLAPELVVYLLLYIWRVLRGSSLALEALKLPQASSCNTNTTFLGLTGICLILEKVLFCVRLYEAFLFLVLPCGGIITAISFPPSKRYCTTAYCTFAHHDQEHKKFFFEIQGYLCDDDKFSQGENF